VAIRQLLFYWSDNVQGCNSCTTFELSRVTHRFSLRQPQPKRYQVTQIPTNRGLSDRRSYKSNSAAAEMKISLIALLILQKLL
jgi:hypothetical protein